jgi:NAD(P)H-hydrate epimerase
MSGAIALAGMAALRGGAGLVRLAVPDVCLDTVAGFEPCYMTVPLPADGEGRIHVAAKDALARVAEAATVVACGPGLGRSSQLSDLICWIYEVFPQPMVLDADALFALSQRPEPMDKASGPRILTPHAGEFRRFLDRDCDSREDLERWAVKLASEWGAVLVLKGHRTLITDGETTSHNSTGNAGMATGGSGDVLTGVITALLCQGLSPLDAARLGAYVHGLAGDLAVERLGQTSLIASDLVDFLPQALQKVS